ncbi:MAG: cyclase family protein [Nitrospira sp.]|nr:cyclase family protein [Nitrospira sp.]
MLIPVLLTILAVGGCTMSQPLTGTIVDLTYPFDEHTVYWPKNEPFHWEKTSWGPTQTGYWYASAVYSASEHGGTHLDAPIHFAESGWSVDEIPVDQLTGEAIVLDIRAQVGSNPDYTLQVDDIAQWEISHGPIPPKAIVLLYTGFGQYWPDKPRYLGSSTPDDATTLHFPGFSAEAATFLIAKRDILGIGIDTASIDAGQSRDFPVHQILGRANRYALENVAHLRRLPPKGARITALPMKIQGGTGGPARIIATVP